MFNRFAPARPLAEASAKCWREFRLFPKRKKIFNVPLKIDGRSGVLNSDCSKLSKAAIKKAIRES